MEFEIAERRRELALAVAQLQVFEAMYKDTGDNKKAAIMSEIAQAVEQAKFFFEHAHVEEEDFDD